MIKWGIFTDHNFVEIHLPKETNREWLQDLPSEQFARCITSMAFLMKHMSVSDWEKMFLDWLDEPRKQ